MKKLLLLFLIVALTAMAGCSLSTPGNSQSGSDITPVYVVRFVPNGAPLINSVKVLEGNTVPEPDEPVLDGKIFDGWYADADLTIRWDFDVDVVIEDTKLYAKWIDGHTHSYSQIVTKPTCTDGGFTTFTCSCGEKYVDDKIAALGHDYVRTVVDPTCTENGYTLNKCERCDYSYQEKPTAAKGHTKIVDVAVDPTCTATGLTEGAHCQDCNVTLVEQNKIPANGHNYVSETTEPDCLSAGVITSTCTACDDIRTEEGDPALGHDVVIDTAKAPDCSNVGLTEGSHCARCGEVLVAPSIVPAKGHTEQTIPAVDPTCTESGLSAGIECSECGEVLVAQNVIDPIDHEEVVIPAVSATCSSTGLTEGKKCSVCDIVLLEQNEVEKLAHTPGAAASCTTAQVCTVCNETLVNPLGHTPVEGAYCDEAEYCQVCGEVFEGFSHTIIPATCTEPEKCSNCPYVGADALGHEYNSFVKEPTCTAAGYTYYLCVRCDDTNGNKKDNVVTKLGHDYYDMITEPTCTEEGRTTRNCYRCDVSTVTSTTPALGHAYRTTQVVEATCTAEGYTVFTCEKCSHTYNDKVTAALGHNEKKVITAATCTTDGFTTNTCTRCSNVRISDVVYALGHEYTSVIVPSKCAERGYT